MKLIEPNVIDSNSIFIAFVAIKQWWKPMFDLKKIEKLKPFVNLHHPIMLFGALFY